MTIILVEKKVSGFSKSTGYLLLVTNRQVDDSVRISALPVLLVTNRQVDDKIFAIFYDCIS